MAIVHFLVLHLNFRLWVTCLIVVFCSMSRNEISVDSKVGKIQFRTITYAVLLYICC